jgi:hypothetical protein
VLHSIRLERLAKDKQSSSLGPFCKLQIKWSEFTIKAFKICCHFLSPSAIGRVWTHYLRMMSHVLYQCATSAQKQGLNKVNLARQNAAFKFVVLKVITLKKMIMNGRQVIVRQLWRNKDCISQQRWQSSQRMKPHISIFHRHLWWSLQGFTAFYIRAVSQTSMKIGYLRLYSLGWQSSQSVKYTYLYSTDVFD